MSHRVITWSTHKFATGYEWRVYSFGYQVPQETLKSGICNTRAKAMGEAKRWTIYLKGKAIREAAAPRHDLAAQIAKLGADSLLPDWQPLTPAQSSDAHRREGSGFVSVHHE